MRRIKLFLKGNVDLHDSLHSCKVGGQRLWNGINEALRSSHPSVNARIIHETWTRSDALLAATGFVPEVIAGRQLPLGFYPAPSQFSRAVFSTDADAIILSLQPDVASGMLRHRRDGFFFYPAEQDTWPAADRAWLKADFDSIGHLAFAASMSALGQIIDAIQQKTAAPILIYNLSPVIPGDAVHCYLGLDETLANRIRRFNLGLVELSQTKGISIVDVETLVARHGADRLKIDGVHLTAQGYRLVAQEVVRVLDDLDFLQAE